MTKWRDHFTGRLLAFAGSRPAFWDRDGLVPQVEIQPYNSRAIISGPVPVKRPSLGALLLSLLPFAAMCFSVGLWDRVDPMILGIPFNLFWLICWIVLSTVCMWTAYRVEAARDKKNRGPQ